MLRFVGKRLYEPLYTSELNFTSTGISKFPTFRVLSPSGETSSGFKNPFSESEAKRMFDTMISVSAFDSILYDVQRQGRISFYMQNSGEEALQVGSAAALESVDVVWPQYRELGVFLWRGFTGQMVTDQCMSVKAEVGKGRQMPVHYCFPQGNIQAVTSPIATQLTQAAGMGYAFRLDGEGKVSVAYFGEGASSEGDFSVALNFAAVKQSQTLFLCRNNGYAISTPANEQFATDGVAPRGPGFGVLTARVDGNDVFAVFEAVKKAREISVSDKRPVLLELMTYRKGHHSTSDDASRYRPAGELEKHQPEDGISRFASYLIKNKIINADYEFEIRTLKKSEILEALKNSEGKKKGSIKDMFTDVYSEMPWHLQEQYHQIKSHVEKHKDKYNLDKYESDQ